MRLPIRFSQSFALSTALLLIAGGRGLAQTPNPVLDAPGFQQKRDYFSAAPFEHIDTLSGNLILRFTDLTLPGNAGSELRFERTYNSKTRRWYFGISGYALAIGDETPVENPLDPQDKAPKLFMSDGSERRMAWMQQPFASDASTLRFAISRDFWKYDRVNQTLQTPDGTTCTYVRMAGLGGLRLARCRDVFGNNVRFYWTDSTLTVRQDLRMTPQDETECDADQCRVITMTYANGPDLPSSITYNGRTWTYTPTVATLPEGVRWEYTFDADLTSVRTPQGGVISYAYDTEPYPGPVPGEFYTIVVRTRTTSGTLPPGRWEYDYNILADTLSSRTEVDAIFDGKRIRQTYLYEPWNGPETTLFDGRGGALPLMRRVVQDCTDPACPTTLESEARGYEFINRLDWIAFGVLAMETRTIMRYDGGGQQTYATRFEYRDADFGDYERPFRITETGDGLQRTTTRTYRHLTSPYIVGLLERQGIELGSKPGEIFETLAAFDPATGFKTSETRYEIPTTFGKDDRGNLASVTKGNGKSTGFAYSWGAVQTITTGAYQIVREINPDGTIKSQTSQTPVGRKTEFTYDDLSRVTSETRPGVSNVITTVYGTGTVRVTRGRSFTITTLDGFGRPVGTENSAGVHTSNRYDAEGQIVYEGFPFATMDIGVTIEHDALGRVTKRTTADGKSVTYTYGNGTVTTVDEKNRTTVQTWKAFGNPDDAQLTNVRDAIGNNWTYTYDALGKLTRVDAPPGPNGEAIARTWIYRTVLRDGVSYGTTLLASETHPESETTQYTDYDGAGNLKRKVDAKGREYLYDYDENDRLKKITASGEITEFTYETGSDKRKTASTQSDNVSSIFDYDTAGRLQTRRDTVDGTVYTTTFGYDGNDNVDYVIYPFGRVVDYTYDSENRILSMTEAGSGQVFANGFQYHPSGAVRQFVSGNGVVNTIDFHPTRYWPVSIATTNAGGEQLQLTYHYDDVGNITDIFDGRAGMDQTFIPDDLDRLQTATGPYGTTTFDYDPHGNQKGGFNYGPGMRLVGRDGVVTYAYDDVGNMTHAFSSEFTYTPDNLLRTAKIAGGVTTTYAYDVDGWRLKKTDGTTTSHFLRGLQGELLTEKRMSSGGSTVIRDYIYAGTRLIASIDVNASGAPPAPTNLRAQVSGRNVTVNWDLSPGAMSYILQVGHAAGATDVGEFGVNASFSVSNVPPGSYYLRVIAIGLSGARSSASNEIAVTIQ